MSTKDIFSDLRKFSIIFTYLVGFIFFMYMLDFALSPHHLLVKIFGSIGCLILMFSVFYIGSKLKKSVEVSDVGD